MEQYHDKLFFAMPGVHRLVVITCFLRLAPTPYPKKILTLSLHPSNFNTTGPHHRSSSEETGFGQKSRSSPEKQPAASNGRLSPRQTRLPPWTHAHDDRAFTSQNQTETLGEGASRGAGH